MFNRVRYLWQQLAFSTICFWASLFLMHPNIALATKLGDLAASMQPGTWAELTTNNISATLANLGGASGTMLIYSDDMVWHPGTQQVFMVGSDHLAPVGPQFVSYTASDNSWQRLAKPAWLNLTFFHGYDHNAIDKARGFFYHRPYNQNNVYRYNIASQTWTQLPSPSTYTNCCDALEYFPELDGLVWVHGGLGEIWLFKEITQQWTKIATWPANDGGTWNFAEYNPVYKVLVFGSGNSGTLFKLSSSGQVTQLRNPSVSTYDGSGYSGVFTVDPVSGKYLLLSPTSRQLYTYDVNTDTWQAQSSPTLPNLSNTGVAATPLDTYGVTLFTSCTSTDCRAYLYKHAAGTGTVVPSASTPTVSIFASPTSVVSGSASTLTWSSTNTSSCTASGGWSGTKAISGSQNTGNLTANTTYTISCTGPGGSTNQTVAVTVTASTPTATPPSPGTSTLLVKFGKSGTLNSFGLSGWSTVIKDIYTDYQDIGPGGTTIVVGDNYSYNYQGVTGLARNFLAGDKIRTTWYNNSASSVTFTPNITFAVADRIISGSGGTWYPMTSVTVPAFGSAFSEYTFTSASTGTYSLVNVNVNYSNTQVIIADKMELLSAGSSSTQPGLPSVLLSASPTSIASGSSSVLSWSSTNASSCTASGGWTGARATAGTASTGTLNANTTFILSCTGTGGTASQSATVTVTASTPPPAPPTGSTDFQTRCSAAGIVRCFGFDSNADLGTTGSSAFGANFGNFNNSGTCNSSPTVLCPVIDSTISASGGGSLKFTIPSQSGSGGSGQWFTNFSTDLSTQFGENSEFYVQWQQRFSPEFLSTIYQGGGGWKQDIIGTGDKPGTVYGSCSSLETVTQNTFQRGFPQMYNSCTGSTSHGPYNAFEQSFGTFDIKMQNGRPAPYCLYSQGQTNPKTYFPPAGNCFSYFANEWMTFQVHIKTGPRVNDEFTNSFVQLWIARQGQPSELVFDWGPYNLSAGSAAENERYGKIWLLPYHTGKDSTQVHPTGYTWYDELIISRSKIADPNTMTSPPPTTTQPPASPTGLTLK
jgi:hypothetical protein